MVWVGWAVFIVALVLAFVGARRERRVPKRLVRAVALPFTPDEEALVERRGKRLFVDKLVAYRLLHS